MKLVSTKREYRRYAHVSGTEPGGAAQRPTDHRTDLPQPQQAAPPACATTASSRCRCVMPSPCWPTCTRPDDDGRFPALIAASPLPRQIQDPGRRWVFIEAGATDFWVPRGCARDRQCARHRRLRAGSASSTPRNAGTCTTSSSGRLPSRGVTATVGMIGISYLRDDPARGRRRAPAAPAGDLPQSRSPPTSTRRPATTACSARRSSPRSWR